ncbi:LysE family transporter, partial [Pelagibacteraceae bacterium]|nr:LysE family transporter [Pelagibacteraceae bacterium]
LAYDTYTAKLNSIKSKSKNLKSRFSFYRDGFLVAGLSPKAIIFFGTIFSSFIDFSGNYLAQFIILMTTYVILDFATLMIYGFAAQKVSVWLKSNPKTLNTISACVLLIIALYVGISQNY